MCVQLRLLRVQQHWQTPAILNVGHCMQMAEEALADAKSDQAAASSRLTAVKARLPQQAPPPAIPPAQQAPSNRASTDDAAAGEDDDSEQQHRAGPVVPALKLQQLVAESQEVVLTPEQRRSLNEAQAAAEAAEATLSAAQAAATAAGDHGWSNLQTAFEPRMS